MSLVEAIGEAVIGLSIIVVAFSIHPVLGVIAMLSVIVSAG